MATTACSIRSSFDLGWGGVSRSQLQSTIASAEMDRAQQRRSMQLDQEICLQQLSCPMDASFTSKGEQLLPQADQAAELSQLQQLLLQQAQQQAPESAEVGIDAQIQQLLQLKQYLRRTKQSSGAQQQQQQQQVVLEDLALTPDAPSTLDVTASGLYTSSALCSPMPSESMLNAPSDLSAGGWSNLAAARAAAQPSARHSVDLGGLAQQLAALELSNNAAAAALAESQALGDLASGMHPAVSCATGINNNRLSIDCTGLSTMTNDDLVAAATMAAAAQAQAEAASRRTSLCLTGPQMSGLLDDMAVLNSLTQLQAQSQLQAAAAAAAARQSIDAASAGAALAMQSSLYSPATPPLEAQMQATMATAGMGGLGMPSPAAMAAAQRSPARHSLDCNLLGASGLPPAAMAGLVGLQSPAAGMPPAMCGRASLNLPQPPLLADRGLAMAQAQAQAAQNEAAGWGFSGRRAAAGGRASVDVRRVSSELPRMQTPDLRHAAPRKSISMLNPHSGGSATSSSASSSSSGRSSPRGNKQLGAGSAAQGQPAARRASFDSRPPMQPPRASPSAASAAAKAGQQGCEGPCGTATATVTTAGSAPAARKGTGVFIPACMLKAA